MVIVICNVICHKNSLLDESRVKSDEKPEAQVILDPRPMSRVGLEPTTYGSRVM